ncbi:uncharacterized protein BJ212DRAFT_1579480, partial [Suillus subaureus]
MQKVTHRLLVNHADTHQRRLASPMSCWGWNVSSKASAQQKEPCTMSTRPSGWSLVGNITDVPNIKPWLTFAKWGKKY